MLEKVFPSGAELQEFLLASASPDSLILVPHQRLARQLWHRQRLAALARGARAWEPLTCRTLGAWWQELLDRLWLPQAPPPPLVRLRLWRRAIAAAPPLEGIAADLTWAAALEEAYQLLSRHRLAALPPQEPDSALLRWRREVIGHYEALLREEGWLSPGSLPALLLDALEAGRLPLPSTVLVAGLEAPAPMEAEFLSALARHTRVMHLRVRGHPEAVREAWVLKDPAEEMAWVAARLVEAAVREGLALHRVAVTSPVMDRYLPDFRRVLRELLGPPAAEEGGRYNFSAGWRLTDTPLFAAALLPLSFFVRGERREDLAGLIFSPFYTRLAAARPRLARWDRHFRETGPIRGWENFRRMLQAEAGEEPVGALLSGLSALAEFQGSAAAWKARLTSLWQELGFPGEPDSREAGIYRHLEEVLAGVAAALEEDPLSLTEYHDWVQHAAAAVELAGEGREEAGFQVLGLLETRGLDFDRVFCLGMTSGNFPAPPRPLPLLSPWERSQVLGGTAASQYRFARDLFAGLLGTAPHLVLTRPAVVEEEDQVGTYLWEGPWRETGLSPLSTPHPAWLGVAAVRAALAPPPPPPEPSPGPVKVPLPAEVRITHVQTGLSCPCRFLLEVLLNLTELPEEKGGLSPLDRGRALHQVVARFVSTFGEVLEKTGVWEDNRAREYLEEAVREVLEPHLGDPHWRAEHLRWLGDDTVPGLLTAWLEVEKARYLEGWRWVGVEAEFRGLAVEGCAFTLRGSIDRLDHHPESGEVIVWDYKSGRLPNGEAVFTRREEYQLPGYLLAVRRGAVAAPGPAQFFRAGFIGLKSTRDEHLKHEDYQREAEDWEEILAAWEDRLRELARRLEAGDFSPAPVPAPEGRREGACTFCPYPLVCGYRGVEETEAEEA